MKIFCWLGWHHWGPWVAHTDGPCVFVSEIHIFRQCWNCTRQKHDFAKIKN